MYWDFYKGKEPVTQDRTKNDVIVVQSNDLIDTPRDLTLREYKLFLFLVSNINPMSDKDFRVIRVGVNDFADALGIKRDKNIYHSLRETTMQLMTRVIHIPKRLKGKIIQTHFISDTCYSIGKGYVELTISPTMTPLLLELKDRFTSYRLENIKCLTSIYSIRIYEMIKSFERLGNRVFNIEELRNNLGLRPTELINFKDFNRRVLSISRREINGKTDLRLEYEPIKEGRKVTQVQFKVKFVKPRKPRAEIIPLPLRKNGSCEVISSVADNLLASFTSTVTTKKCVSARSSITKEASKPVIAGSKPVKKKSVIIQTKTSDTEDVLVLKLSGWQRLKYLFKQAFRG